MRFLILINNAPGYKYFYAEIAQALEKSGHEAFFAVISKKSVLLEPLAYVDNNPKTFFFDEYMLQYDGQFDEAFDLDITWGEVFFSDFDRFFCHNYNLDNGSDYWLNIYCGLAQFFTSKLEENDIDVVLYENVSNTFAYMAYAICRKMNRIYLGLANSRLPNRYEIQASIYNADEIIPLGVDEYVSEQENLWYTDYMRGFLCTQPDYMKNNTLNKKVNFLDLFHPRKLKTLHKYYNAYRKDDSYYDFQSGNSLKQAWVMFKINFHKYHNEKNSNKFYLSEEKTLELIEKQSEKFFLYPTHYHPEASTSILARDYCNEFANIVNIHNNIPVGTYLYVKDHISARGIQNKEFYKKISALPGVRLIHFNADVKKIIPYAEGVITVTSTVGYEAALMGKPVYLFGRVFYENFPNVHKLINFSDITRQIYKYTDAHDSDDMWRYLIGYFRYTYPGKLLINCPSEWSVTYFSTLVETLVKRAYEEMQHGQ